MRKGSSIRASSPPRVIMAANTAWNIVNFRSGLVRALKSAGYEVIVVTPEDVAGKVDFHAMGVTHVPIDMKRSGKNPFKDAMIILRYLAIIKRFRPRAFLGFTIKPNLYGSIASRMAGVDMLANISGLGSAFSKDGPVRRLIISFYKLSFSPKTKVFFQNPDDQEEFLSNKIVSRDQAILLPGSGIDLNYFALTALPDGRITFLLAARLLVDKGVRVYAEAARVLKKQLPDARLQLLGPLDPDNPSGISASELNGWIDEGVVEYLGAADDVRPFIANAHFVVLPTVYREGVPHVLLEAASMGRPVITTDTPGCREAVEDSVSGRICQPGSVESLVEVISSCASLPISEISAMGTAGRSRMERRFDERFVHSSYLNALRNPVASAV